MQEAVTQADVVVTLSDAAEVLFAASQLKPEALVCAMGGRYEFNRDVLDKASVFVVDEMEFVAASGNASYWIRSGQLTREHLDERLDATIGEILLGGKSVNASGGRTLAIIQGMAICDLALAKTILDRVHDGR
jgi:ornithine cyclodeaminase/alanine dehydrogenase-like protein (mu-crystallin family)